MASIQGVKVTGVIVPSDTLDTYAVIDPIYGIDGLRNLTGGTSDLNLITTPRRRAGMLVGINNGASYYKLNAAPWNNTISDWTLVSFGGGIFTGGTVSGSTRFTNGLTANTFSATTYLNLPLDKFITGGTYNINTGVVTFKNNSGDTFNVTGFSSGIFTGGTVSGSTTFTNGLTANTISATTYLNLPLDKFITGSSFNNLTYDLTLTRNDGVSIPSNLSILASDMNVTGGTYNINTGVVKFTNNSGGTFNVTGFSSGMTDTFTTGGTYNINTGVVKFTNNSGGTFNVTGFSSGMTDTFTTGGSVTDGTATFTKNNGGTYTVSGFATNNLQKIITGNYTATSADNNYTILINNGSTPITITTPSGLLSKISIGFIQQGTADVTISAGAGVTINSPASMSKIKGQHYWAYLEQVSNSNVYQLVGSLKT